MIYIIKSGVCLSVCGHYNVQTLTSPPVLKLWDTQGYLWLPYDQLIWVTFKQKNTLCYFLVLLSFLPDYCHSFRISVIPSEYCRSFRADYSENYKY